jgi:hypothetical protein
MKKNKIQIFLLTAFSIGSLLLIIWGTNFNYRAKLSLNKVNDYTYSLDKQEFELYNNETYIFYSDYIEDIISIIYCNDNFTCKFEQWSINSLGSQIEKNFSQTLETINKGNIKQKVYVNRKKSNIFISGVEELRMYDLSNVNKSIILVEWTNLNIGFSGNSCNGFAENTNGELFAFCVSSANGTSNTGTIYIFNQFGEKQFTLENKITSDNSISLGYINPIFINNEYFISLDTNLKQTHILDLSSGKQFLNKYHYGYSMRIKNNDNLIEFLNIETGEKKEINFADLLSMSEEVL